MDRALISWRADARTDATAELERAEAERSDLRVDAALSNGTLVSGAEDALEGLEARGYRVKRLRDTNLLRIGSHRIDVERGEPEVEGDLDVPDEGAGDWPHHLVQLIAPPEPQWVAAIEGRAVKVVEQVGSYGLFVAGGPDDVDALGQLPFVAWTGRFKPAYRIHPELLEMEGTIRFVSLSVFPPERADGVEAAAEAAGARIEQRWDASSMSANDYAIVIVEADAAVVPALAAIPHVRWLEFEPPKASPDGERETQIVAENLDGAPAPDTAPVTGYQTWLAEVGLSGNGVRVAIVDSGVDKNAANNASGHLDVRGRQADFVDYTDGQATTDTKGHGTHVAGIAIGNAASGGADANSFMLGQGMAPAATFLNQNYLDDASTLPPGPYAVLTRDSVLGEAHVMNNSWGGVVVNAGYTLACSTLDRLARDPNETSPAIDYLAIVFSSGNEGGGASTLTTPHEVKNPIVVGNSLTSRPSFFPSDNINGISGTSSRGPAVDGRIVPQVVAPGTNVSAAATATLDQHVTKSGTSMAAPHVSGACALLIEWWRTQHSGQNPSPAMLKALLVNGAIDLAGGENWRVTNGRQADKNMWSVHSGNVHKRTLSFTPAKVASASSYLTKVNSADDIAAAGQWFFDGATSVLYVRMPDNSNPGAADVPLVHVLDAQPLPPIPNGDQGWGRVSLENVLLQAPLSDRGPKVFFDEGGPFTASAQQFQTDVVPWNSSLPLRVTLAWTDAPGAAGANPALVNDLDLEVTEVATGNVYKGNVFANGLSVTGGAFDSVNNVECVYVPNPTGTYTVRVVASSVTANARPPYDMVPWQDFALVVDNVDVPSTDPVNVVPVLDRSGSMVASGYVDVTRVSSQQFVDASRINDGLGVVSFGDTGDVEFPAGAGALQTVTGQAVRAAAKTEIDSIVFGGCTFMGDGLVKAGALLAPAPEPRAIVLFSDGYDNKGCDAGNAEKPSAMGALAMLPPETRVYTCAMGPASDQALLEQIAVATAGEYYYMPSIADLVEIYNYIQADVSGESLVANESASASRSSVAAFVDAAATEASFNVTWTDPHLQLVSSEPQSPREISVTLRDPHGRALHPASTQLRTIEGEGYVVLKLADPAPGLWHVEVATAEEVHVRYTVGAFVRSPIRLEVMPVRRGLVTGTPLTIGARVWDGRRPVAAVGTMTVAAPGAGIPDLVRKHADALKSIRPSEGMTADAVPEPLARLMTLRDALLKDQGADLFSTTVTTVRLESVKRPPRLPLPVAERSRVTPDVSGTRTGLAVSSRSSLKIPPDAGLAIATGGPFLRGQFKATGQSGSYNVAVTTSGFAPGSRTRFQRKALVSLRVS